MDLPYLALAQLLVCRVNAMGERNHTATVTEVHKSRSSHLELG